MPLSNTCAGDYVSNIAQAYYDTFTCKFCAKPANLTVKNFYSLKFFVYLITAVFSFLENGL